ncbi:hypothetical protein AMECASPLE_013700 [Ameca splendens]|uniref:Uncharacterized protein n=1 Tax=Ameca splendens TaxID=208324 RepID=A0ABV0XEI2_9TELE
MFNFLPLHNLILWFENDKMWQEFKEQAYCLYSTQKTLGNCLISCLPVCLYTPSSEFGDVLLYSRPSFLSGQAQRESGCNSSNLQSCGGSRTKQEEQVTLTEQAEEFLKT